MRHILLTIALSCVAAAPAAAQQLTLSFNDGLVTLDATSAPVRSILNEWAKKGGTKVIGIERLGGAPLTLKLVDVPEAKALEIVLRSAAGYMAAPRQASAGASIYDRILVMATSAAPAPAAARPPAPQNRGMAGTQRFVPPQRRARSADGDQNDDSEEQEEDLNPPEPPVFTFPGAPTNGQPGSTTNPEGSQEQQDNPPGPTTMPSVAPFGSSTPGGISTPPPAQPGQRRPPGA